MRAPGSRFGRTIRHRVEEILDARFPGRPRRPGHLDDTFREAMEAAERAALRVLPGARRVPAPGAVLKARIRAVLKAEFPIQLERFTDREWEAIGQFAKARTGTRGAKFNTKGFIAEQLIPQLPQFGVLHRELATALPTLVKQLPELRGVTPEVLFVRDVTALSPQDGKLRWLGLTDGAFVAYARDPSGKPTRVVVLGVFEAKSPGNYPDLAEEGLGWRKILERDPKWRERAQKPRGTRALHGQFSRDFERFSELRIKIDGVEFSPEQVTISRKPKITRWVPVLPKGMNFNDAERTLLTAQGFSVEERAWTLSVEDKQLNNIAQAVLKEVATW